MDFQTELARFEQLQRELMRTNWVLESVAPHAFVMKTQAGISKNANIEKDIDLLFVGLIHGNEVAGLAVLNALLEEFQSSSSLNFIESAKKANLSFGFALGNIPAGHKNVRFVEKDLNRVFGTNETSCHEERRARKLELLFKRSRYIFDIHQTIEPTPSPFFIFGFDQGSYEMARTLNPEMPIISYSIEERKQNGLVATSYAILNGSVAVTAELGQKGFYPDQISLGLQLSHNAIQFVHKMKQTNNFGFQMLKQIWSDCFSRFSSRRDSSILVLSYRHPNSEEDQNELLPGFKNFADIEKGQLLGTSVRGDIIAPIKGKILFPKYGAAKKGSKELFVLMEEVPVKSFRASCKIKQQV